MYAVKVLNILGKYSIYTYNFSSDKVLYILTKENFLQIVNLR